MNRRLETILVIALLGITFTFTFSVIARARNEQPEPRAAKDIAALVTITGAHSHIEEPTYLRITSANDFQDLYMRHLGEPPEKFDEYYNPHGVPRIDFERCMVVAVFGGNSSNSAGIYVHSVVEDRENVIVRFDHRSYQTGGSSSAGNPDRVTPYAFFVMPRVTQAQVLEEDVQSIIGDPPVWKERARFPALK